MLKNEKVSIYEDEHGLEISFRWFSPMAYFLAFFCLLWDGFLVLWYLLASGSGAPLMMVVFPLLHVAAGVYLTYYTICLFVNRTYIDVTADEVLVTHKPYHWWWGNTSLPIKDIEQFYVKQTSANSNNGRTEYNYELRAKMKDYDDQKVVAVNGISEQKLRKIEAHLENYLAIEDQPVKGEHFKLKSAKSPIKPRLAPQQEFSSAALAAVYRTKPQDKVYVKSQWLEVASTIRYDWNDANSDQLLQLIDDDRQETLILIEQNKALLTAFEEEKIPLLESEDIEFNLEAPAKSLVFEGQLFTLYKHNVGTYLFRNHKTPMEVEQWTYISTDKQQQIRITNHQKMLTFYQGNRLEEEDFDQYLDLRQMPDKAIDYQKPRWRDEDLV